jgi:hypothetical protein
LERQYQAIIENTAEIEKVLPDKEAKVIFDSTFSNKNSLKN